MSDGCIMSHPVISFVSSRIRDVFCPRVNSKCAQDITREGENGPTLQDSTIQIHLKPTPISLLSRLSPLSHPNPAAGELMERRRQAQHHGRPQLVLVPVGLGLAAAAGAIPVEQSRSGGWNWLARATLPDPPRSTASFPSSIRC
jgi:hypothetical protein